MWTLYITSPPCAQKHAFHPTHPINPKHQNYLTEALWLIILKNLYENACVFCQKYQCVLLIVSGAKNKLIKIYLDQSPVMFLDNYCTDNLSINLRLKKNLKNLFYFNILKTQKQKILRLALLRPKLPPQA